MGKRSGTDVFFLLSSVSSVIFEGTDEYCPVDAVAMEGSFNNILLFDVSRKNWVKICMLSGSH